MAFRCLVGLAFFIYIYIAFFLCVWDPEKILVIASFRAFIHPRLALLSAGLNFD